jgi:hypothetical protein
MKELKGKTAFVTGGSGREAHLSNAIYSEDA